MALKPRERAKRLEMARRFESGGDSKSEFCRREGISTCKLEYWLRNLALERGHFEGEFVEVRVSDSVATDRVLTCELELPHGVKLKFFGPPQ